MHTVYCNKFTGKLFKWNSSLLANANATTNIINPGKPLSIEYKKISITSTNFDLFGSSQLMVTNSIKTTHTKEKVLDNVVYYDKSVLPTKRVGGILYKTCNYTIDNFDPSEYGNPICYYNPSYNAGTINLVTKFFEMDDVGYVKGIINGIKNVLTTATLIPIPIPTVVTPYLSVANKVISTGFDNFLASFVCNKELCKEHIIEFRTDDHTKPFVTGYYICLPNVDNADKLRYIVDNYYWEDNAMVTNVDNKVSEYDESYFVLEIADNHKEGLLDFDFAAMTNQLLVKKDVGEFIHISKNSDDLERIKLICDMVDIDGVENLSEQDKTIVKINYLHLSDASRHWFDKIFYNASCDIKKI